MSYSVASTELQHSAAPLEPTPDTHVRSSCRKWSYPQRSPSFHSFVTLNDTTFTPSPRLSRSH
ncbi:hypothetical protein PC116_g4806 [Phytophthora cactorum]|nr:hypothetical protein PC114_g4705 [Phytophthora cactorum]KAG3190283.1 hypothetical protein C6341_g1763 [Phytophthora cactorum]KAG4247386.1 hypothetical protein PC116_g4806 [Phytophthora cactorum]